MYEYEKKAICSLCGSNCLLCNGGDACDGFCAEPDHSDILHT